MRFITYLRLNAVNILNNIQTVFLVITALAAYVFPFALVYEAVLANGVNSMLIIVCIFLLGLWTILFLQLSISSMKKF